MNFEQNPQHTINPMKAKYLLALALLVPSLTHAQHIYQSDDDANDAPSATKRGAAYGGVVGGVAGAVIGNQIHHHAVIGGVIGALSGVVVGGAIGNSQDQQQYRQPQQRVIYQPTQPTVVCVQQPNADTIRAAQQEADSARRSLACAEQQLQRAQTDLEYARVRSINAQRTLCELQGR